MGFLEFLKWMFSKDARYVPLLALSEGTEDGEKGLWFSCEGDYNSECCEIVERLCAGRYAVTWMEDLFWKDERQGKKKREIIYHTTFPMYYAREIAGMDDLQRGLRPDAFCRVSGKGIRLFVRQPDVCAGICAARLSYAF